MTLVEIRNDLDHSITVEVVESYSHQDKIYVTIGKISDSIVDRNNYGIFKVEKARL